MAVERIRELSVAILDVCKAHYADIDAITADRDLWRWRFEQVVARLETELGSRDLEDCNPVGIVKDLHAAALEIMAATPKEKE